MKRKKIYISRSMLTDVYKIKYFADCLERLGFDVTFYEKEDVYNDNLVKNADIVLVHPHTTGSSNVGKGQYTEIQLAKKLDIPVYIISSDISPESFNDIFAYNIDNLKIIDDTSWKKDYGAVYIDVPNKVKLVEHLLLVSILTDTVENELLLLIDILSN